jgi:hypothetical protein
MAINSDQRPQQRQANNHRLYRFIKSPLSHLSVKLHHSSRDMPLLLALLFLTVSNGNAAVYIRSFILMGHHQNRFTFSGPIDELLLGDDQGVGRDQITSGATSTTTINQTGEQ